jgi:hypothetical protein
MTVFPVAGGGDEQVAVVALLAGERDLFEQSLMKDLGTQLDGAEHQARSGMRLGCGLRRELVCLVGDEVAAVPVALEDGADLGDDVGVARA